MPRIADALEHESQTVDLEQGGFERLLARRERKQRNRRIREGVLAVIVALATGIILFRSFRPDPVPADRLIPKPPPAAAGTLTYARGGHIYVADPDGSHAVKISNGSAEGSMWSPDGRYLAYRSAKGCGISNAEGNVLAAFLCDGWQIAWSPDSTRVAVWDTFDYEGPSTIGVYGLDGARQMQLAMPPAWRPSGDHDPAWMPDGTGVWVEGVELPLDGSPPRYLKGHTDPYATYSPDGSLIAYSTGSSLSLARSDGSEPRVVVHRSVGWAGDWGHPWSPAGDRIAFTAPVPGSHSMEVGFVDVATGQVRMLAEGDPDAELQAIGFSPTGDRILYSSRIGDASRTIEQSLWSVGLDGSDARRIVDGTIEGQWLSG